MKEGKKKCKIINYGIVLSATMRTRKNFHRRFIRSTIKHQGAKEELLGLDRNWWITLNRNLWLALLVVTSIAFGDNIQLIRIKRILILIKLSENHPTSLWTRKLRGIWKNRDYLWSDENTCLGPAAHQLKRWRMNWRLEQNYKLIFISVGMGYKLWRVGVRISAAQFGPARNWKNQTKSIYFLKIKIEPKNVSTKWTKFGPIEPFQCCSPLRPHLIFFP